MSPTRPACSPSCSSTNSQRGAIDPGLPGYCWNTQYMIGQTSGLLGSGEQLWPHFHHSRTMVPLGTWWYSSPQIWSAAPRWCRYKSFRHHVPYLHMCGRMLCSKLCTLNQAVQDNRRLWRMSSTTCGVLRAKVLTVQGCWRHFHGWSRPRCA